MPSEKLKVYNDVLVPRLTEFLNIYVEAKELLLTVDLKLGNMHTDGFMADMRACLRR